MTDVNDTPQSPPTPPVIPVGLGTKLGLFGTSVLAVIALVTAVLHGDHTFETLVSLAGAVALLYKVVDGRYQQAAAIYRASHSVLNTVGAFLQPSAVEDERPGPYEVR